MRTCRWRNGDRTSAPGQSGVNASLSRMSTGTTFTIRTTSRISITRRTGCPRPGNRAGVARSRDARAFFVCCRCALYAHRSPPQRAILFSLRCGNALGAVGPTEVSDGAELGVYTWGGGGGGGWRPAPPPSRVYGLWF